MISTSSLVITNAEVIVSPYGKLHNSDHCRILLSHSQVGVPEDILQVPRVIHKKRLKPQCRGSLRS